MGLDGKTVMLLEKLLHQKEEAESVKRRQERAEARPARRYGLGQRMQQYATEEGPGRKRRERKEQLFQLFFVQGNRQQPDPRNRLMARELPTIHVRVWKLIGSNSSIDPATLAEVLPDAKLLHSIARPMPILPIRLETICRIRDVARHERRSSIRRYRRLVVRRRRIPGMSRSQRATPY